ncbi:ATP-binding protein [Nocardioides mangrovi]|uniref:histidine kinase n=1 Tax=Nocardioides mangrovi TaxID=2874580 RepID=A0ABS7U8U9_9ACTN|nr:ATP-binding protein [Nocardioides mangrovi]MBZ5737394.1 PAS domain-containing protein [Nocardioides mangrovi]
MLLLLSAGAPALDTASGWDATSYAGWPGVGISACLFVRGGGAWRWWNFAIQSLALGLVLGATYDVPWWQGSVASLAVTVPGSLSAHWVRPGSVALRRFNEGEVDAYHGTTALAGLVCGVLSAMAAAGAGRGGVDQVVLTGVVSFFAATTAQLVLLPFVLRRAGGWFTAGNSVELAAQRTMLLLFTAGIFAPHAMLPVTFLLFPVLGWAAIRAKAPETHLQVLVVSVSAFVAALAERGPLALESISHHDQFAPLLVYMFMASVCYLLVPLALTVERLTSVTRQATRAATTVQRMLDSATGTVFIATDLDGLVTHCNPGAEAAIGVRAADLIGRFTFSLHAEEEVRRQAAALGVDGNDHRGRYEAAVSAQMAAGLRRDWEFIRGDGARRVISLNLSRLTEPGGRPLGYIASGEDITERVRAQQALEQAYRRERAAAEAFRSADEMKQELVSIVSHELRTPITNINGYAELLRDGDMGRLSDSQAMAVARISRNGTRLHGLVDDLLTLSRAEAGGLAIDVRPVDLNDVALAAHDMVTTQLANRNLVVRVRLAPYPVVVHGDQGLLERAVANLWSNAIKFTPDGGTIDLGVGMERGPSSRSLRFITVQDSGMGIPPAEHEDVFTRFYRTAAAGEHAVQGSGLGLSIVKTIVEQHAGTIVLDSAPSSGTTMQIRLPAPSS